MTKSNKPSNFAPIFIASTVILFLGSAFKFVFNKDNASEVEQGKTQKSQIAPNLSDEEQDSETHEPEEDPVQSL